MLFSRLDCVFASYRLLVSLCVMVKNISGGVASQNNLESELIKFVTVDLNPTSQV